MNFNTDEATSFLDYFNQDQVTYTAFKPISQGNPLAMKKTTLPRNEFLTEAQRLTGLGLTIKVYIPHLLVVDDDQNGRRVDWPLEPHVIIQSAHCEDRFHYIWRLETDVSEAEICVLLLAANRLYLLDMISEKIESVNVIPGSENFKRPEYLHTYKAVSYLGRKPYSRNEIANVFAIPEFGMWIDGYEHAFPGNDTWPLELALKHVSCLCGS